MPVAPTYRPETIHARLGDAFFDPVDAANFPEHKLRFRNDRWAARVGLGELDDAEWVTHFGRFAPLPDNLPKPLALRYHGHQFRHYNPDIGDGRGFLFAQLRDDAHRLLDLGTKGSGRTPYSRTGDGRLTLKGGVREILATEMLEALGVNTSKTFSLIETGEALERGDEPSPTRSAVLVRLNHSHIRIGTFQRLAAYGETDEIKRLVDHCIEHYWPEAANDPDPVIGFYRRVVDAVATMGAQWMAAGFVHGVLNTDNITITGESFDYGPWRFIPEVDPGFTAAYFDQTGLYAFGRQPQALEWNLARLAECLLDLAEQEKLQLGLQLFRPVFQRTFGAAVLARLGLASADPESDAALARELFEALHATRAPFEQSIHDLFGGGLPDRLASSPNAAVYERSEMAGVLGVLCDRRQVAGVDEALSAPMSKGQPPTLLIDEVETVWSAIAERDDWTPLECKIQKMRAYGAWRSSFASLPNAATDV